MILDLQGQELKLKDEVIYHYCTNIIEKGIIDKFTKNSIIINGAWGRRQIQYREDKNCRQIYKLNG